MADEPLIFAISLSSNAAMEAEATTAERFKHCILFHAFENVSLLRIARWSICHHL